MFTVFLGFQAHQPWTALWFWAPAMSLILACELTRFDRKLARQVMSTFEAWYLTVVMVSATVSTLVWKSANPDRSAVDAVVTSMGNAVSIPLMVLFDSAVGYPLWLKRVFFAAFATSTAVICFDVFADKSDYLLVVLDRSFSLKSYVSSSTMTILSFLVKYSAKNFRTPGRCCVLNVPVEARLNRHSRPPPTI